MNKTQFLYWLHEYFCGSCLHSLGLSCGSVWQSFRACIGPWTALGCFWSRYYRYPSFYSYLQFPQCISRLLYQHLSVCGSLWESWGKCRVVRIESVPHLRCCLRGNLLLSCGHSLQDPPDSILQGINLVLVFVLHWPLHPKGDPCSKFTTAVGKSSFLTSQNKVMGGMQWPKFTFIS